MPDEPQNTNPRIVLRISKGLAVFIKWLFIIILALLLTIGLIFHAPWKVLVLLAIFFFTLTIIPKRARKYIWLSFALIILILVVWSFIPEDDTGWRPYTIDDEIATFNAKYAVPDEQNAAVIYEQLLEQYDGVRFIFPDMSDVDLKGEPNFPAILERMIKNQPKNTFYPDSWTSELDNLTRTKPWSSKEYPELAQWLKEKHGCTIELLIQASEKEGYYQPLKSDRLLLTNFDMQSAMMDWSRLLIRAANNDRADGRIEQAIEKYLATLKTATLFAQQPEYSLMGLPITPFTIRNLNDFVIATDLSNEQLLNIKSAVTNSLYCWDFYWRRRLEYDMILTKNSLISYEVSPNGKLRFARGIADRQLKKRYNIDNPPSRINKIGFKISAVLSWFFMPSHPDKILNIVDEVYQNYYQNFDWTKEPVGFSFRSIRLNYQFIVQMLSWIPEPAYYKIHNNIYPRALSQKRTTQLIIALKQYKNKHGGWPQSLDDLTDAVNNRVLTDPINNEKFVYKTTDDGFTIYSKGKNKIDEAGVKDKITGVDDIMFWPIQQNDNQGKPVDD